MRIVCCCIITVLFGVGIWAHEDCHREELRGDMPTASPGRVDEADLAALIFHLFEGGPPWSYCPERADVNNDGVNNLSDIVYLSQYLFNNGPAPEPAVICCIP